MKRMRMAFLAFFLACAMLFAMSGALATDSGESEENFAGYIVRMKSDSPLVRSFGALPTTLEQVSDIEGLYVADTLEELAPYVYSGMVEYIEPNYYVELLDDYTPPDDYHPDTPTNSNWNLKMIDMPYVWEYGAEYHAGGLTGAGVRVAVIDSGIHASHEDFVGTNIEAGHNYTTEYDQQPDDDVTDSYGHGTFVSGIIAAQANNGRGVPGIAPAVTIVPLRVFYEAGDGTQTSTTAAVVAAINDAAAADKFNCDVINMSLGIRYETQLSPSLTAAVNNAVAAGCILIAAAGNRGDKPDPENSYLYYPAAFENVISVGSVTSAGQVAGTSQRNAFINVVAPGAGMYGLWKTDDTSYVSGSGTSYAAPHVTALAALALQVNPFIVQAEFMAAIENMTDPVNGDDAYAGSGIINAKKMLENLPSAMQLTRSESGVELDARFWSLTADKDYCIVAAAYNAAGHMLECVYLENLTALPVGKLDPICVQFTAPDIDTVRVFLLDAGDFTAPCAPLERR